MIALGKKKNKIKAISLRSFILPRLLDRAGLSPGVQDPGPGVIQAPPTPALMSQSWEIHKISLKAVLQTEQAARTNLRLITAF